MHIPPGSLLDPSDTAAVVGGNVLTCQRIVDVVFRAFETCAASQGCMNNVTFGDDSVGYYETVAGGAGAVSGCGLSLSIIMFNVPLCCLNSIMYHKHSLCTLPTLPLFPCPVSL